MINIAAASAVNNNHSTIMTPGLVNLPIGTISWDSLSQNNSKTVTPFDSNDRTHSHLLLCHLISLSFRKNVQISGA
jgi:hypothetical protein